MSASILNANFDDLENEISKVSLVSDFLHLDIMDNKFVPNFSFSMVRASEIITFSKLPVDTHLMVEDPDFQAPKYAEFGCHSVTFHLEAVKDARNTIKNIRSNGSKVGIAIKPMTEFSTVANLVEHIDLLLIMTVEPGFGGQAFLQDQMSKVTIAREHIDKYPEPKPLLQVDGGISVDTIEIAAQSGANCFVAGSAVFKSNDPAQMLVRLRQLAAEKIKN
jgi:ribulose-phosphate 3-epimerase